MVRAYSLSYHTRVAQISSIHICSSATCGQCCTGFVNLAIYIPNKNGGRDIHVMNAPTFQHKLSTSSKITSYEIIAQMFGEVDAFCFIEEPLCHQKHFQTTHTSLPTDLRVDNILPGIAVFHGGSAVFVEV